MLITDREDMGYVNVAFPLPVNQVFTYGVPSRLDMVLRPGVRVLAPFRRTLAEGVVVERVQETDLAPDRIKDISDCLDEKPTFSAGMLRLTRWMADYYVSSWGVALFCAVPAAVRMQKRQRIRLLPDAPLPSGSEEKRVVAILEAEGSLSPHQLVRRTGLSLQQLRRRLTVLREKGVVGVEIVHKAKASTQMSSVVCLALPEAAIESEIAQLRCVMDADGSSSVSVSGSRRRIGDGKRAELLQHLLDEGVPLTTKELTRRVNTSVATLRTLERRGLVRIKQARVVRNPLSADPVARTQPLRLNVAQSLALGEIRRVLAVHADDTVGGSPTFLLHGVTGSGKTEVYMQAMAEVLESGKSVIVLVPEISLTPQTASRFVGRFGDQVAVLHSGLSDGERHDQWHRIRRGEATIVIGPRSAVFAPVRDLGLLIIDEEHSDAYKSDVAPRYHAREVAQKRSELANCPLLLGSATPSLESFHLAEKGRYRLLNLRERVLNRKMPDVSIVDMRSELKKGNRTIFSDLLRRSIEERLVRREQIILFLNRRGHSTYVFCRNCGYVEGCDSCSISMTYHFSTGQLVCHHCGAKRRTRSACPQCSSPAIRYFGIGTEAVEREVMKAFPGANVRRFDADTTARKGAHQQILEAFAGQEIDILIGTQMVSKGLDFPNVTLVGVIAADTALNLPDFRASEQTFSLLTQVAGRSGRADLEGKVVIQTYLPDHYSIAAAQHHDYVGFYRRELEARSAFRYPPFSHVAMLVLRGKDEGAVIKAAHVVREYLEGLRVGSGGVSRVLGTGEVGELDVEILGPAPAPLSKIEGKFRWHLLLRSGSVEKIVRPLRSLMREPPDAVKLSGVEFVVDIDPTNTL